MHESAAGLEALQHRLDESMVTAGEHLGRIFDADHRPAAAEIAAKLDGIIEVDLTTASP